jgi:5-hydroxyisourate hydrolase-like protein (transthyretin family)
MGNRNRFLVGLTLLILMGAFLPGQSMNAQIFGNVKNEDGKALAGVKVEVTNINNNAVTTSTTGKKGKFRLLSLAPGLYQVSFELEGYQTYVMSGIQLNAEQSVTLRIKLKKKE